MSCRGFFVSGQKFLADHLPVDVTRRPRLLCKPRHNLPPQPSLAPWLQSLAAALKAAAPQLTPAHAIDAAWALGVLGASDKDAVSALFNVAASAISSAPDSLAPAQVAALYEAAALSPEAKLPEQVGVPLGGVVGGGCRLLCHWGPCALLRAALGQVGEGVGAGWNVFVGGGWGESIS